MEFFHRGKSIFLPKLNLDTNVEIRKNYIIEVGPFFLKSHVFTGRIPSDISLSLTGTLAHPVYTQDLFMILFYSVEFNREKEKMQMQTWNIILLQ